MSLGGDAPRTEEEVWGSAVLLREAKLLNGQALLARGCWYDSRCAHQETDWGWLWKILELNLYTYFFQKIKKIFKLRAYFHSSRYVGHLVRNAHSQTLGEYRGSQSLGPQESVWFNKFAD